MKRTYWIAAILLITSVCLGAQYDARERIVPIGSGDVTTYDAASGQGVKYYEFDFQVPGMAEGVTLESAILEFFVDAASVLQGDFHWFDADSVEQVGYTARTPLLEVYALKSPIDGSVREGQLDKTTMACTPVLTGDNRRVVVDITPIVRSFSSERAPNYGIVVGAFTGSQEGNFTLKSGAFPDGSRARVHLTFASAR